METSNITGFYQPMKRIICQCTIYWMETCLGKTIDLNFYHVKYSEAGLDSEDNQNSKYPQYCTLEEREQAQVKQVQPSMFYATSRIHEVFGHFTTNPQYQNSGQKGKVFALLSAAQLGEHHHY